MMKYLITFALLLALSSLYSQAIDGSFAHETDPDKKYSIYLPSSYDPAIPSPLMLGLHPLNTNRWDAKAWRDTLIVFAETNQLILACPDGGPDGKIDDAIDTSFTSVLLDSMSLWYNIDQEEKYVMGFSWGGKTTYSYGLRRTDKFKGYLVIGAAVSLNEVADVIPNAEEEAFYLLHGNNDSPGIRYEPLLSALDAVGACTNSELMPGVGHTIDFPDRNEKLTAAYQWLKTTSCLPSATAELNAVINLYPNPTADAISIEGIDIAELHLTVTDLKGRALAFSTNFNTIYFEDDYRGIILVQIKDEDNHFIEKILRF